MRRNLDGWRPTIGRDAVTASGFKVSKIHRGNGEVYPISGTMHSSSGITKLSWTEDGGFYTNVTHFYDLVGDWVDPVEKIIEPPHKFSDEAMKIDLEGIRSGDKIFVALEFVERAANGNLIVKSTRAYKEDQAIVSPLSVRAVYWADTIANGDRVKAVGGDPDIHGIVRSDVIKDKVLVEWSNGNVKSASVASLYRF